MGENAVRDAQPAHVGALRRCAVEQAVVAPAEIVGRLRGFVLSGLLLQPLIGVERMLLALEFLLVGKLAAGLDGAVLRFEVDRVGADRLGCGGGGLAVSRRARDLEAGGEALQVALLLGREIAGHGVTPPAPSRWRRLWS